MDKTCEQASDTVEEYSREVMDFSVDPHSLHEMDWHDVKITMG